MSTRKDDVAAGNGRGRGWSAFLKHRWPVLIGLAAGTLGLIDDGIDGSEVTAQLAVITLIMAAAYLPIGPFEGSWATPRC